MSKIDISQLIANASRQDWLVPNGVEVGPEGYLSRGVFHMRNNAFGDSRDPRFATNNKHVQKACEQIDPIVLEACKKALAFVNLTNSLGLSTTVDGACYESFKSYRYDAEIASIVTLDCAEEPDNIGIGTTPNEILLPYTMSGFKYRGRELCQWSRQNVPLDRILPEESAYSVAFSIEDTAINGNPKFNLKGINTDAQEYTPAKGPWLNEDGTWNTEVSALDIRCDVQNMIQQLVNCCKNSGPYVLILPCDLEIILDSYCDSDCNKTVLQSLLELRRISRVEVLECQPPGCVTLMEARTRTYRNVIGMAPQTVPVVDMFNGCIQQFRTMAISVPDVRCAKEGCLMIVKGDFGYQPEGIRQAVRRPGRPKKKAETAGDPPAANGQ